MSAIHLNKADNAETVVHAGQLNPLATKFTKQGDIMKIVYNRLLGAWYIVRGQHQTPIGGRFESKQAAQAWLARDR
jgi:hypothetical protein